MSLWKPLLSPALRLPICLNRRILSNASAPRRSYAKKHNPSPKCGGPGDESCGMSVKNACKTEIPRQAKNIEKEFPFMHLIQFPKECCDNLCIDKDFPSFDECFYKVSDKNKRKYQVTWVECPPVKIKPKKICCFAKAKRPPIQRRKPAQKPETACPVEQECADQNSLGCPKIRMPGCKAVRSNVKCFIQREPTDCTKVKAPYPAFSECRKPRPRKKARVECDCLEAVSVCEVMEEMERRRRSGRLNKKPCG
ncbi:uncharacterized protein LOC108596210 [Drosophila busckii]|nr:uncharacterized protein LOC108596210 [Drosophila busckii]